jgi:hypothetical protein
MRKTLPWIAVVVVLVGSPTSFADGRLRRVSGHAR